MTQRKRLRKGVGKMYGVRLKTYSTVQYFTKDYQVVWTGGKKEKRPDNRYLIGIDTSVSTPDGIMSR